MTFSEQLKRVMHEKRMTQKQLSELTGIGKSEQFVRIGLQRGILPFGSAVKTSSKYSYYISPKLFEEYTGVKPE